MIRYLAAFAVAVSISGCAVDSDDPIPAPAQKEPQRDPPAQTLGGRLELPGDQSSPFEDQAHPRPTVPGPESAIPQQQQKK